MKLLKLTSLGLVGPIGVLSESNSFCYRNKRWFRAGYCLLTDAGDPFPLVMVCGFVKPIQEWTGKRCN